MTKDALRACGRPVRTVQQRREHVLLAQPFKPDCPPGHEECQSGPRVLTGPFRRSEERQAKMVLCLALIFLGLNATVLGEFRVLVGPLRVVYGDLPLLLCPDLGVPDSQYVVDGPDDSDQEEAGHKVGDCTIAAVGKLHAAQQAGTLVLDGFIAQEVVDITLQGFGRRVAVGRFGFQAAHQDCVYFPREALRVRPRAIGTLPVEFLRLHCLRRERVV